MKIAFILLATTLALSPIISRAAEETSEADSDFIQAALNNTNQELELGKLASQRAFRPDIREFGLQIADEHKDMRDELQSLANNRGLLVAVEFPPGEHSKEWDRISKLGGDEFDREFLAQVVKDHETALKLLDEEAKSGQNAKVKESAARTLATEKLHLERAQVLQRGPAVPAWGLKK
jgi:putative membrane protein